jgi:hypothetical protein
MRVRVAMWMAGLLLSSIAAEASLTSFKPSMAIVDSNTRIRKLGTEIAAASEIQVSGGSGRH